MQTQRKLTMFNRKNKSSTNNKVLIRLGQGDLTNKIEFIQFVCADVEFLQAIIKKFSLGDLPFHTSRFKQVENNQEKVGILRITQEEYEKFFLGKTIDIQMGTNKIPFTVPATLTFDYLQEIREHKKTILTDFKNKLDQFSTIPDNKKITQSKSFFTRVYELLKISDYDKSHYVKHPDDIIRQLIEWIEIEKKSVITQVFSNEKYKTLLLELSSVLQKPNQPQPTSTLSNSSATSTSTLTSSSTTIAAINMPFTEEEASQDVVQIEKMKTQLSSILLFLAQLEVLKNHTEVQSNQERIYRYQAVLKPFCEVMANFLNVSFSEIIFSKADESTIAILKKELLSQDWSQREKNITACLKSISERLSEKLKLMSLDKEYSTEVTSSLKETFDGWNKSLTGNSNQAIKKVSLTDLEQLLFLRDKLDILSDSISLIIKSAIEEAINQIKVFYHRIKIESGQGQEGVSYHPRLQNEIMKLKEDLLNDFLEEKNRFDMILEIFDQIIQLEKNLFQNSELAPNLEKIKDFRGFIQDQNKNSTSSPSSPNAPTSTAAIIDGSITTITQASTNTAQPTSATKPNNAIDLDIVLENSKKFFEKFSEKNLPTANRLNTLIENGRLTKEAALKQIQSVRIILPEELKSVLTHFINNKKQYGSSIEKSFYENMTEEQLILRFFQKRAIVFTNLAGMDDYYLLNDMKTTGFNDLAFEKVGTESEGKLKLSDCLSYDEMKLSALVGLSGLTSFINNGNRMNNGKASEKDDFEKEGVFIALTGPRFEKECFMEYQDIFVTPNQNKPENGYGQDLQSPDNKNINIEKAKALEPFAKYYKQTNDRFPTYLEVEKKYDSYSEENKDKCEYIFARHGLFINKTVYKERIRLSLIPLLDDAIAHSKISGKPVFLSVPGLGLSPAWSADCFDVLGALQLEVYHELLSNPIYSAIKVIDFNYFPETEKCLETFDRLFEHNPNKLPQTFSYTYGSRKEGGFKQFKYGKDAILREGSSKIDDQFILIRVLPWDSNAAIGNEYFMGRLNASGDPACACSATIPEVFNEFINPGFVQESNLFYYGNNPSLTNTVSTESNSSIQKIYANSAEPKSNYAPTHFKPSSFVGTQDQNKLQEPEKEKEFAAKKN